MSGLKHFIQTGSKWKVVSLFVYLGFVPAEGLILSLNIDKGLKGVLLMASWGVLAVIGLWAYRIRKQYQSDIATTSGADAARNGSVSIEMKVSGPNSGSGSKSVVKFDSTAGASEILSKYDEGHKGGYLDVKVFEDKVELACALPYSASVEEMKHFKKSVQLKIKELRHILKETTQGMSSVRANTTLSQIRGVRAKGLFGLMNRLNRINADEKLRPKQGRKEALQDCIRELEGAIIRIDQMIHEASQKKAA